MLPSADAEFPGLAYGTPPGPAGGAGGGLTAWGGSVVADPGNADAAGRSGGKGKKQKKKLKKKLKFHLFAAEMSLGCGLNAWYRNSAIVHATAPSPLGPFVREEQVLGAFSHEPYVLTLPEGRGYVLYKIGCADNATTGSNATWPCRECAACAWGMPPLDVRWGVCSHRRMLAPGTAGPPPSARAQLIPMPMPTHRNHRKPPRISSNLVHLNRHRRKGGL